MTDATANTVDHLDEPMPEDRARSFLVAATWTAATFSIGISLVLSIWLAIEHLPDGFFWDLLTG